MYNYFSSLKQLNTNYIIKFLLIIFLITFCLFIFVSHGLPSAGYTYDIYQLPFNEFWFFLIGFFILGVMFLNFNLKISKFVGILIIILTFITVLLVPVFLGYFNYGSDDELSHLGEIQTIINSYQISATNIYPTTHIEYAILSELSTLSPNILGVKLYFIFSLFFVSSMYLFVIKLLKRGYKKYCVILLPTLFLFYLGHFHVSIIPDYISFVSIPLTFYIFLKWIDMKTDNNKYLILLLISIIYTLLSHPFTLIFFTAIISSFMILRLNFINTRVHILKDYSFKFSSLLYLLLISWIIWLGWFSYNYFYLSRLKVNINAFINEVTNPVIEEGYITFSKIKMTNEEMLNFIYYYYGEYVFIISIIIIAIALYLFRRLFFSDEERGILKEISIIFIITAGIEAFFLFNPLLAHNFDRIINLNYCIFGLIPLFIILFNKLIEIQTNQKIKISILIIVFAILFSSSLFSVYLSPKVYRINIAVTNNEVTGMNWLFTNKDDNPIYSITGSLGYRYSDLLMGHAETLKRLNHDILRPTSGKISPHFNYDVTKNYAYDSQYIVLNSLGENIYNNIPTNYLSSERQLNQPFNKNDFDRFYNDKNTVKIYDSRNIKIFKT